ncbi:hypothetical protein [Streptomyces sp. AN091965]|uniref:hypothetical protein n=1 Tax=Streptomyces sp. AN091965 TaxID=2927803 RepID=UPI001F60004E|nr:hypothetical protein [Streptomyces sp. AN091965]MCI3928834.1 hypothetical protein [Streptomyces sp. AN091965]
MVTGESSRRGKWRVVCAGLGAAALLVVGGCGGPPATKPSEDVDADGDETTSTQKAAASPSTSTAGTARERATAAYVGMWRDMAEAARTSDWKSPRLARYATGDALETITRGMYTDHRNGLITKGMPENAPRVTKLAPASAPTTAVISDCGDSTHWLKYRKRTGGLVDDEPGGRQSISAEVKKQKSGGWKVTRFAVWEVGSC